MAKWASRPLVVISLGAALAIGGSVLVLRGMNKVWSSPRDYSRCSEPNYAAYRWRLAGPPPTTNNRSADDDSYPSTDILVQTCIQNELKAYIDTDYGQTNDLAKAFLTLITATFVASISFSEKIVNIQTSPKVSSVAMFISWLLLLASIFACGVGLSLNLSSLYVLKYNAMNPMDLQFDSLLMFSLSGISFALGLASMLIAALPNLTKSDEKVAFDPEAKCAELGKV